LNRIIAVGTLQQNWECVVVTTYMSPINLHSDDGLGYWGKTEENNGNPGVGASPNAKECIDVHWMKY
jgi:hypothetical protein